MSAFVCCAPERQCNLPVRCGTSAGKLRSQVAHAVAHLDECKDEAEETDGVVFGVEEVHLLPADGVLISCSCRTFTRCCVTASSAAVTASAVASSELQPYVTDPQAGR